MDTPDYRAAALTAMEAAEREAPPEVKTVEKTDERMDPTIVVPPEVDGAGKDGLRTEGKTDAPVKAGEKPEDAPKSRFEKSFEDLVREKAALRKQADELKQKSSQLSRDEKLMEAVRSGDPAAILAAAGVKYDPAKAIEVKANDPMKTLAEEVRELKEQLAGKTRAENRNNVLSQMKTMASKDNVKFQYVAALGEEDAALSYVDRYYAENQELPVPGDLAASMELALEATENRLRKEAERYKKVSAGLTTDPGASKKDAEKAVPPAVSNTSKTLTNSTGAGPKAVSTSQQPKRLSSEDYRKAAIDLAEADG